ncbi:MAG: phosphopantetheine-binding protein, partial [Actinomycetota bacterium]|nr:phosphopantetheine-binding protein [Actinomycetota bacterium]
GTYVPPQGELEEQVAAVWSEVLGIERIGAETNFFDLGGHSLLATRVVSRLSAALEREVPLRLMFEKPTVSALAQALGAAVGDGAAYGAPIVGAMSTRPGDH